MLSTYMLKRIAYGVTLPLLIGRALGNAIIPPADLQWHGSADVVFLTVLFSVLHFWIVGREVKEMRQ